jgi:hypothetical protein
MTGPASGAGWTGHRYTFASDPLFTGKPIAHCGKTYVPSTKIPLTGTVDIDGQGRVRRLELVQQEGGGAWMRGTILYSFYGLHVTVSAPPPGQVENPPHPTLPKGAKPICP